MSTGNRAFTLVEALAAVVILAVGVSSVLHGFTVLGRTELRMRTAEKLQRLAEDKYDELMATGQTSQSGLNGDFSDIGENGYSWSLDVEPSGVDNLNSVVVTVTPSRGSTQDKAIAYGLQFVPPATAGAGQ